MSKNSDSEPEKSSDDKEDVKENFRVIGHSQSEDVKKVLQVRNAALAVASQKGRLEPWSKDSFILYCCCFIAFLCSCANGYDGSLMTAINAMPFYQRRFNSGALGPTTGLIFSIYTIGGLVGPFFAGPLTDSKLGRRGAMQIGAILICLGTAVISSSMEKPQFIGGRFILGFGVSILTCAAPSYVAEISPPQWRGRMTAFYNLGWFGGSIPAAAVTLGCQSIQSDWSWRLPLIFQAVPSLVVILCVWLLPESPRWLVANSRDAEALAFLTRFHGNGDPQNPVVALEWAEFKESIAVDGADKRYIDIHVPLHDFNGIDGVMLEVGGITVNYSFKSRNARWRSLVVIMMACFGQFSGYFNVEIYGSLGYSNHQQFVLNLANSIVSAAAAGLGVALSDRMPRRQALIWGTLGCAFFLALNGGLSVKWAHMPENQKILSVGQGGVAAFFFFNIVFSFAYTPLQGLYAVEVLQTTARAKGMSMYGVVVSLFSFINLYAGPVALQNIKYNYIFIFVAWDVVEASLWYLFGVETVGRSLEELEELFSSPNPVAASKRKRIIAVKQSGDVAIVDA